MKFTKVSKPIHDKLRLLRDMLRSPLYAHKPRTCKFTYEGSTYNLGLGNIEYWLNEEELDLEFVMKAANLLYSQLRDRHI